MLVYLASSMRNHILNSRIDIYLRSKGIKVFLPQRDNTAVSQQVQEEGFLKALYRSNLEAIDRADVVLIVARNIGTDTAWECGYAIGKNKRVYLLMEDKDDISNMYMLYGALFNVIHRVDYSTEEAFHRSMDALIYVLRDQE